MRPVALLSVVLVALASALLSGCPPEGCLKGNEGCVLPSPCETLTFSCDDEALQIRVLEAGDIPIGGLDALASVGDVLMSNGQVQVVIDALNHPHYLAPTGGGIVDLTSASGDDDSMRHFVQATGVLPDEAANYTSLTVIEEDGLVAVQVSGTLDSRPEVPIHTRYELRACDPGVRIRSELINLEPDPISVLLGDGHYMGNRELLPFTPGNGYEQPSFGLSTLGDAISDKSFVAFGGHSDPAVSYATVSCSEATVTGFRSTEVALDGASRRIVMPRDYAIYERFLAVGEGPTVSSAVDVAMDVREQLFEEARAQVSGQLTGGGGMPFGDAVRASITISEVGDDGELLAATHTLPAADGTFSASVPDGRDYRIVVDAYGRTVAESNLSVSGDSDAGSLEVPAEGAITLTATVDGVADHVLAFILPTDETFEPEVTSGLYGQIHDCAPLLGHPHGASPACNRVLIDPDDPDGTTVGLPPGQYDVYAIAGPFSTLGEATGVTVPDSGDPVDVALAIQTLPQLQPQGTLTGDFHVHGGTSFDSNMPNLDRMRSFLASRLQVIASTEHDAAWNFAASRDALGADDRVAIMVGTENTGHILNKLLPDSEFPKVVGHWNVWPIEFDAEGPYRGSYWDELAEPGMLFTRALERGFDPDEGVIQLNHPLGGGSFGRDFAWGNAIGVNLTEPLPSQFDGTEVSLFGRTPPEASFANSDFDTQEVMNGTNNVNFLIYRAFWHWLLNQGIVRAGMGNSDTHSLTENVVGIPMTVVWTDSTVADFDVAEFNGAVKAGRSFGTNGPVLDVTTTSNLEELVRPSTEPFVPGAGASLNITVTAAPWVPLEEIRIYVDGALERTLDPGDREAVDGITFADGTVSIPLADLVGTTDSWISVEAGWPLEPNEDLDCDGAVDTGDNNGDGSIDWRDVDAFSELESAPEGPCFEESGPLTDPAATADRAGALYRFRTVVPDGYPLAFSNPLLVDFDGDGFDAPGVN
ncbi:MAG: CehA/McbA family metallohydrolase [Proteobacteria bacterium]|nr:CehA/McbA family metallohydrolase [Pseudomonadota bacterium]